MWMVCYSAGTLIGCSKSHWPFCLYSALSSIKILFLLFGRSGCSFPSSQDTHGLAIQLKPNKIALGMFFIQMVSFGAHKSSLIQRCQKFFPSKCFCHNKKIDFAMMCACQSIEIR